GLGHARARPGRVPHHPYAHLSHAVLAQQALAHVVEDEFGCWAAHGSECEVDVDDAVTLVDGIDHAEVDEVYRHLGILDLSERSPEPLGHESPLWCVLRNLWNSSWNIATISALRGPRARQRASTSSQVIGCLKSQRLASAS